MTPAHRISVAWRRIGSAVGAVLVRGDDKKRLERNSGVSAAELHARQVAHADAVERRALLWQDTLDKD